MALLKLGRGIPALRSLAGSLGRGGALDQHLWLAQHNQLWWSSSATTDNKDSKIRADEEEASAAARTEPSVKPQGQSDAQNEELNADTGNGPPTEQAEGANLLTPVEMMAQLTKEQAAKGKLSEEVEELTDKLKRSLAEMENVRMRSAREVETAKKFGPQSLVKELLDIPDNLERAAASVPEEVLQASTAGGNGGAEEAEKLRKLLKGLLEGVKATERVLLQVLRKQGVEQFNPLGEKFDPNFHAALFEVPDPSKEPGTVAVVTKRGYMMHERVVRPAEVGVARAP